MSIIVCFIGFCQALLTLVCLSLLDAQACSGSYVHSLAAELSTAAFVRDIAQHLGDRIMNFKAR